MAARVFELKDHEGPPNDRVAPICAPRVGQLVDIDHEGNLRVEVSGGRGLLLARVAMPIARASLERAAGRRQQALFVFEDRELEKPIFVGLLQPPEERLPEVSCSLEPPARGGQPIVVDTDADGRRVHVSAQDEIVFQCGKASVTLKRSARIAIRGTYAETRSSGTNRMKGGQVRIN